ncbi:hypothetical protein GCM10009808_16180 [Microbacterium sediminicola]|uniref:ABC transporter domain-containing protein n=1 Tax=Microbacterium sediminicola TaxID=415210 RepID=A0ABN2I6B9_9MICO
MTAALAAHVVVDRPAFRVDLRVDLAPGEILAIMGPSGAGKSTLLDALAGFVPLSDGAIQIAGRLVARADVARPRHGIHLAPAARGVALLSQDPRLFPHLSARENIAFGPRARGLSRETARQVADEWLDRVGLPDAGHRHPHELSGGQQQRVALARALAADPALVLLDEPLTGLDPLTAEELRAVLATQLSCTAIIATHSVRDAAVLAHRLALIEEGRFSQQGLLDDILDAPATPFAAALFRETPVRRRDSPQ